MEKAKVEYIKTCKRCGRIIDSKICPYCRMNQDSTEVTGLGH